MAAADGLRQAIDGVAAIDHHAHLLARADAPVGLAEVLTESHDPRQVEAVRESPAFRRGLVELGRVMGVDAADAEAACAAARVADHAGHVERLLARCRLDAMFVDDGFRVDGSMSLDEHAALVRCPVRRIVRIETEAESAAVGRPPFEECRARFGRSIADAFAAGAIGLKTIAAYRCGLDLPAPDRSRAEVAYDGWRRSGTPRLTDRDLIAQFIADGLDAAGPGVPLQVHTGLGDADALLLAGDPALTQPQIDHGMLTDVPVVFLHCYPFVRHAGYLASLYANVHFDVSLAVTLMPHRGPALLTEALELAPASKLLFATDASRLAEMFFLSALWWRSSLTAALGRLVDDDFLDESEAVARAEAILAGNARRLYRIRDAGSAAAT